MSFTILHRPWNVERTDLLELLSLFSLCCLTPADASNVLRNEKLFEAFRLLSISLQRGVILPLPTLESLLELLLLVCVRYPSFLVAPDARGSIAELANALLHHSVSPTSSQLTSLPPPIHSFGARGSSRAFHRLCQRVRYVLDLLLSGSSLHPQFEEGVDYDSLDDPLAALNRIAEFWLLFDPKSGLAPLPLSSDVAMTWQVLLPTLMKFRASPGKDESISFELVARSLEVLLLASHAAFSARDPELSQVGLDRLEALSVLLEETTPLLVGSSASEGHALVLHTSLTLLVSLSELIPTRLARCEPLVRFTGSLCVLLCGLLTLP